MNYLIMNYRKAKLADLQKIFKCGIQNIPVYYSISSLSEIIRSPDYITFVAETKTKFLTGFIIGRFNNSKDFRITSLAVAETHRRRGIATRLIMHLKMHLTKFKSSVKSLTLHVHTENTGAIELYKKMGFKVLKFKKDYYFGLRTKTQDAYKIQTRSSFFLLFDAAI